MRLYYLIHLTLIAFSEVLLSKICQMRDVYGTFLCFFLNVGTLGVVDIGSWHWAARAQKALCDRPRIVVSPFRCRSYFIMFFVSFLSNCRENEVEPLLRL